MSESLAPEVTDDRDIRKHCFLYKMIPGEKIQIIAPSFAKKIHRYYHYKIEH